MTDSFAKTYENLQRQSFRKTINKVWNMVKEDNLSILDQAEQKLSLIIMDHKEYSDYFENKDLLDGREYKMGEGLNPFLHISLHQMVEDQLALETPIEAILFCESLEMTGYSRHEAIHAIIMILIHLIYDAYKKEKPINEEQYKRLLVKCSKVKPSEIQSVVELEFTSN